MAAFDSTAFDTDAFDSGAFDFDAGSATNYSTVLRRRRHRMIAFVVFFLIFF